MILFSTLKNWHQSKCNIYHWAWEESSHWIDLSTESLSSKVTVSTFPDLLIRETKYPVYYLDSGPVLGRGRERTHDTCVPKDGSTSNVSSPFHLDWVGKESLRLGCIDFFPGPWRNFTTRPPRLRREGQLLVTRWFGTEISFPLPLQVVPQFRPRLVEIEPRIDPDLGVWGTDHDKDDEVQKGPVTRYVTPEN